MMEHYIVAIDQSTSASKVFLVNEQGEIVRRFSKNHRQFYPQPGFAEHDAEEIWNHVCEGVAAVTAGFTANQLSAMAISNQRETTVLWERETGKPIHPAIVWQDVRGEWLCEALQTHATMVAAQTGLQLSAYYPALKAASVLAKHPEWQVRAKNGELCIGTIDSYLVYRLTNGKVFQTDVSNASRTQLCAIKAVQWSDELCKLFDIPMVCLPRIVPSDGDFGQTCCSGLPLGIPLTGIMGDSHAALFGQGCLTAGMAKATYGTGSSVMMNVGNRVVTSQNGLSSSVGFGFRGQTHYVLEGNVTCSGDTLCWLRDEAKLISDIAEVEAISAGVESTEGVYFVPAFSGLGAPYFKGHAKAALLGMNRSTTHAHIVRAALESMAYQDAVVIAAMEKDTHAPLQELRVDGGPTQNALLMQFQSNLLGCNVQCAAQSELSALGAAYMAGLSVGLYKQPEEIFAGNRKGVLYQPTLSRAERASLMNGWETAVGHCL